MGNHSVKQESEVSPNGDIELDVVPRERYGVFYVGLDMEARNDAGRTANKTHRKKVKQGKENKSTEKPRSKSKANAVRYGIFYDSLKDQAVIIDMQNKESEE